jgi:hypothetical protein
MRLAALLLLSCSISAAATIAVPGDHPTIPDAIEAAATGDLIVVAPGEYVITEPISFNKVLMLLGSGGAEHTTIRMSQTPADPDRASVFIFDGAEATGSVIEGFTLTGGKGTKGVPSGELARGGGVLCINDASPNFQDCRIIENAAYYGGGVLCFKHAAPTFLGCEITHNAGGGLYCDGASPTLGVCVIAHNLGASAFHSTGRDSRPVLEYCTIRRNSGVVADTTMSDYGGGVLCEDLASPTFANCEIFENFAGRGGGIFCRDEAAPMFINCLVFANQAVDAGGAIMSYSSAITMVNCTIANNASQGTGGGIVSDSMLPVTLTNCISWQSPIEAQASSLSHCLTDQDPLFVSGGQFDFNRTTIVTADGTDYVLPEFVVEVPDYRLSAGSPAIDTGTADGAPTRDIDGNGRPCGAGVDIGAYESGDCPSQGVAFKRGDTNADAAINIADAVFTLVFLFADGTEPTCMDAADSNDDGAINIADPIALLSHLFADSGPLPMPSAMCGVDMTSDELGCERFAPCGGR